MAGDFSREEAEAAWGRLQGEVLPRLGVVEPAWSENPEQAYHRGDPAEREILIQHLADLSYLPQDADAETDDRAIRSAVREWRLELPTLPVGTFLANTLVTAREFLEPGEMQQLAAQVGFEGELEVSRLPALGERSLLSRIVHFRMKSFALRNALAAEVTASFSLGTLLVLADVALLLQVTPTNTYSSELILVNLLGNARELTDVLMKHWGDWVFVFRHEPAEVERSVASELPSLMDSNRRFRTLPTEAQLVYQRLFIASGRHRDDRVPPKEGNRIRNVWGEDGFRYYASADPMRWIREAIEARLPPEQAVDHLVNRLGLELLQLRLWMLGYYRGSVDGEWGPLSFAALQEFLADQDVDPSKLVFPLSGGFVALNFRYLFKRVLPGLEDLSETTRVEDLEALQAETMEQVETGGDWEAVQIASERMQAEEEQLHRGPLVRRRRYRGLWGILAAAGRFLRDVARSVVRAAKALVAALKRGWAAATRIFRHFLRGIRRGVRVIGLAVKRFHHWLVCRPFMSGEERGSRCVLTRFYHDGDAFHFASEGLDARELTRHRRDILRMNLAFEIVVRLAIKAVGLIAAGVSYRWLQLAWRLFRLVSSRFWREMKQLIRRYRETWTPAEVAEWLGPLEA
jgi:hypothetical protein